MSLDIDENAMNKKLQIIPDESSDNLIPWLQSEPSREVNKPHKRIEPFPGACIKTWTENGDKVFINVCHSKEILPPEDISDDKFRDIMTEDVPSFVIPMAIGLEKMAKDKEEIERPTFDILINTTYFEKCMKKSHFWQFTIAAILESINDKYKKNIDTSRHVVLKNRKVMGSLDIFTIEDRKPKKPTVKKPLIQVLDSSESTESSQKPKNEKKQNITKCTTPSPKPNTKHQNYVILESKDKKKLFGLFYLPSSNMADITVDVDENHVIVEDKKSGSITEVFVAHDIDNSLVEASYDSKLQILRLLLPLKC